MAKKTYYCTRHVDHDGEGFEEKAPIALEKKHAEPLLACGAITTEKPTEPEQPAEPEQTAETENTNDSVDGETDGAVGEADE